MDKISVSIPGGNGRMGKTLLRLILESDNYKISSATCLPDEEEVGLDIGNLVGKRKISLELQSDPMSLFENSDVLIDFTVPEATMFHAKKCYENNMSIVIGTTGLDNQQEEELLNLSKKIPIVYSANFSIGVTLLSSLVADATKSLGKELADLNIAVNAVTPAGAKTRILDQMSKEHVARMLSKVPRGRFLEIEEFTSLICWLSSEENSFSTAAVFDISGGRSTY